MIVSLILMAALASGGLAITYIFVKDEPLLWRFSAGAVIGSAVFGTAAFILACFFGLTGIVTAAAVLVACAPLLIFRNRKYKAEFTKDWRRAKDRMQGGNLGKFVSLAYYVFFLILFIAFFEQAMYETAAGIFTGGSQNLGDLPFHLGVILGFSDGANFPPQNPSFSGAKFSYPFIADMITAAFMKLGVGLKDAMLVQNVSWAFALLVILERFVTELTGSRKAGTVAPSLLLFSGGLGFLWFFNDYLQQDRAFVDLLWKLPGDYTISDEFRWGNSLVTLFLTQRSILLGMPLTIVILRYLWKVFTRHTGDPPSAGYRELVPAFVAGLLAGLLPLVHLHSLAVLFVVTGFLLFFRIDALRTWLAFGAGVCVIAVPELIWSITGTASRTSEFFAWHFGWNAGETNVIWFWIKNTGLVFPLIAAGIYLAANRKDEIHEKRRPAEVAEASRISKLLLFYVPFVFLFIVANVAKLAPWDWDNIKVLIYWYIVSTIFIAIVLVWLWEKGNWGKAAASVCFAILILSGTLDVWRTLSGQIKTRVFDADGVHIAERIKQRTPPDALFLNAPTFNTPIVLTGRLSFMRFSGHLGSHGIDFGEREATVKRMYEGGPAAAALLKEYGIDYVLISPEERNTLKVNEEFFRQFPVFAQAGEYKLYKVAD